jgi:hypothetical protein
MGQLKGFLLYSTPYKRTSPWPPSKGEQISDSVPAGDFYSNYRYDRAEYSDITYDREIYLDSPIYREIYLYSMCGGYTLQNSPLNWEIYLDSPVEGYTLQNSPFEGGQGDVNT